MEINAKTFIIKIAKLLSQKWPCTYMTWPHSPDPNLGLVTSCIYLIFCSSQFFLVLIFIEKIISNKIFLKSRSLRFGAQCPRRVPHYILAKPLHLSNIRLMYSFNKYLLSATWYSPVDKITNLTSVDLPHSWAGPIAQGAHGQGAIAACHAPKHPDFPGCPHCSVSNAQAAGPLRVLREVPYHIEVTWWLLG